MRFSSREGFAENYRILNVPINVTSLSAASSAILTWVRDGKSHMVFARDVHGVMLAQKDGRLLDLHYAADLITPDGMPLVWLGRLSGLDVHRTAGPDLLPYVLENLAGHGVRHYFYGGKPGVADILWRNFERSIPNVLIVVAESPPFGDIPDELLDRAAIKIARANADVVWVGISTPRQEFLMERLSQRVPVILIGVGAAFDFHSGERARAPKWMQQSGFEWLFRLAVEPRRLWKRYLVLAPMFVLALIAEKMRGAVRR